MYYNFLNLFAHSSFVLLFKKYIIFPFNFNYLKSLNFLLCSFLFFYCS
nr:MAG TPA: hypothetical protein [Caudoviricetes sp.]